MYLEMDVNVFDNTWRKSITDI